MWRNSNRLRKLKRVGRTDPFSNAPRVNPRVDLRAYRGEIPSEQAKMRANDGGWEKRTAKPEQAFL
ncbi:MAG TPA: hypothetical protein DEF12_07680, partial [Rhodobacteraceae bacterium]|nr:hypothetical protein [Paracoccaceae bacterium]